MILKIIISIVIGGAAGFGIGYALRCTGGTCPLTCNPWGAAIFGALMGLVISLK